MAKKDKEKGNIQSRIINSAIAEGIDALVEDHPRFRKNKQYILSHISSRKVQEKIREIYKSINQKKGWSEGRRLEYLNEELADYIATGSALDEPGKGIILRKGLEEKAKSGLFGGLFARKRLEGEKYLDKTIGSFQELYDLLKTGDYSERMPEVAKAVETIYDMGFLDSAVEILKNYGLINDRKYASFKRDVVKKIREGSGEAVKGIEKYLTAPKVAALILGIVGFGFLIFNLGFTGAVIGTYAKTGANIAGIILIIASIALSLKIKKI